MLFESVRCDECKPYCYSASLLIQNKTTEFCTVYASLNKTRKINEKDFLKNEQKIANFKMHLKSQIYFVDFFLNFFIVMAEENFFPSFE